MRSFPIAGACWLLGSAALAVGCTEATTHEATDTNVTATATARLTAVPLGASEVHYQNVDLEEREPWGPAAVRAADDGTFWVVDTPANRLLHIDAAGQPQGEIALGQSVVGAIDVLPRGDELFVLDAAATTMTVVHFTDAGDLLGSVSLPEQLNGHVDGFLADSEDRVLLHAGGDGVAEVRTRGAQLELSDFAPYDRAGRTLRMSYPDATTLDTIGHRLEIEIGGRTTSLVTDYFMSSARLLRVLGNGDVFVSIEEVTFDPAVLVDLTVLRIDASGQVAGRARYPVADQYIFVRHAITVDDAGGVYFLIAERDRVRLERATLTSELAPVLPERISSMREQFATDENAEGALALDDPSGLIEKQAACLSRDTMISSAFAIVNSATWLTPTNIDRGPAPAPSCTGRGIPDYFATAAVSAQVNMGAVCSGAAPIAGAECVRSEPYDWGGWDTLANYRTRMAQGDRAGDDNTALPNPGEGGASVGVETCSRGIDCSGFIGRMWNTPAWPRADGTTSTAKPGTATLANWSTRLRARADGTLAPLNPSHPGCPAPQPAPAVNLNPNCRNSSVVINRGDIMISSGVHVSMFRQFGNATINGVVNRYPYHFESTEGNNFDRVVYYFWPWTRYDTWTPRTFLHACAP